MGDSAYGSAEMLGWMVYEHGLEPHVTVFDKSARKDGTFSRNDFTYDHEHEVYHCPEALRNSAPWQAAGAPPNTAGTLLRKRSPQPLHETPSAQSLHRI